MTILPPNKITCSLVVATCYFYLQNYFYFILLSFTYKN